MKHAKLVIGSLVGALAIHVALIACVKGGASGTILGDAATGEREAQAQEPSAAPACTQWEVQYDKVGTRVGDTVKPAKLPAGWEPIGAMDFVCGNECVARQTMRRCVQ